jgi:uncharacterized protein (TIGR02757 family)
VKRLSKAELKEFLDEKSDHFNRPSFIENDPISIPHQFTLKQDIEIAGLFAALLAWGQRKTIIRKCQELMAAMDNQPYDFIVNHSAKDLKALKGFKHRTFNEVDLLYFVEALRSLYKEFRTLEPLFVVDSSAPTIEQGLVKFHKRFFALPDSPHRTKKHLPSPEKKSTCKRINMYLRWMVRADNKGVDFGLWKEISPAKLICPLDLHVDRVARKLKLIKRKQTDWQTALELTKNLSDLEPNDPVKYDFALFSLGIEEGWSRLR